MSRGTQYLTFVTEKLTDRIQKLDEKIGEVQKDIEGMHDYYWENYTEMDQYGYENFDNQQALLSQVNANTANINMRRRLKKMLDSPFFGSVDFIYDGEEEAENFYIGIANFAESSGKLPLVYDWRAPACSLFYDYDAGWASYEAPGGTMEGEITSKRQYKIRRGTMIYEFESDMKIDDEILKEELGLGGDTQLKNIVRTIQKEQNAIIRNTKDKIMVIQGAAGSGKTSVALHRIAYLLYHDREHLNSSNILILSPNGVFSNYISHILPELGEENISEMSFDLFAYKELRDTASDCEDRYHHIEREMRFGKTEYGTWKQSEAFVSAAEGFALELEDGLMDFRDVSYKGYVKTAEEILSLFYYKFPEIPLLDRMDAVMEYVVDEYETLYNKNLPEDALLEIREKFRRMYISTDLYDIYNMFLKNEGIPVLPDVPTEERVLAYEDVYPILYLKYRLHGNSKKQNIRHLVIDEMQDYSYLQYVILHQMFSCNMTILGDRAQTVDEKWQDVLLFLPKIFGKKIRRIEMKKSYRNTLEIAAYAKQHSGVTGIEYLTRHGREVTEENFISKEEMLEEVVRQMNGATGKYETMAVLTMTEQEAADCFAMLKELEQEIPVSYIDRDSSVFEKGLTVTTFYQAKGLEFDQVFVIGGEETNPFYSQFQYISATRALHELYVYKVN